MRRPPSAGDDSRHTRPENVEAGTIVARFARLIDSSPAVRDIAIEVGVVDRNWLERPRRGRPPIVSPLEVTRRFVERVVDRHPSMLASVGLNAIELLAWDVFWERRLGLRPPRDTVSHAVVAFTDLAGFTGYTATHGDDAARTVIAAHQRIARGIVRGYGGRVVKGLGDGLMLVFADEAAAVRAALELVENPPAPLAVRAGAHTGELVVTSGDLIGHVVNVAARVTAEAKGGEVMVTTDVLDAAGAVAGVRFGRPRARRLKGVDGKVGIARAERDPAGAPARPTG